MPSSVGYSCEGHLFSMWISLKVRVVSQAKPEHKWSLQLLYFRSLLSCCYFCVKTGIFVFFLKKKKELTDLFLLILIFAGGNDSPLAEKWKRSNECRILLALNSHLHGRFLVKTSLVGKNSICYSFELVPCLLLFYNSLL